MSVVRPRTLIHGGRVRAEALFIDPGLLGEPEARRRCLAAAAQGARITAVAGGYMVTFATPRVVDTERCAGLALTAIGRARSSSPLRPDETVAAAMNPGHVGLVRDGRLEPHPEGSPVDLGAWIDVSHFAVEPTESLGAPPTALRPSVTVTTEATHAATILGPSVPKPDPRVASLLRALATAAPTARRAPTGSSTAPGGLDLDALGRVGLGGRADSGGSGGSWLSRWLARRLAGSQSALPAGTGGSRARDTGPTGGSDPPRGSTAGGAPQPPAPPGRLRRWLQRWMLSTPLADLVGKRQADYVRKTMELFERGQFDEALRHAIPFGGKSSASAGPMLSTPRPRDELTLGGPRAAAASLGFGPDLYDRFQQLYKHAARALEDAGRIEEAAYVQFELLGDDDAGIALLERHERWALAAKMAEQRQMDPGLIVRLLLRAGDARRAIQVARSTGAFADAVGRLESSEPELAERLRIVWADWLASGGDYAAAVDALWPVTAARHIGRHWIDRAIDFGGPAGMRMLVRKLELLGDVPDARAEVRDRVVAIVDDPTPEGRSQRALLLRSLEILSPPLPPLTAELTRLLARHVVLDSGGRTGSEARHAALPDALFRHDVQRLPVIAPVGNVASRPSTFSRNERGLMRVFDAVVLRNGRVLAALGEAGLRLLADDGRTLQRYEHPATHLAINPGTTRAIAGMRRGQTWSLRRIDLVTGRATTWCDAHVDHIADDYDGSRWFVAEGTTLAAIDTQAPGFDALWRVDGLPAPVDALRTDGSSLTLSLGAGPTGEIWRYELTPRGPVLRTRMQVDLAECGGSTSRALGVDGSFVEVAARHPNGCTLRAVRPGGAEATAALDATGLPVTLADGFGFLGSTPESIVLSALHGATVGDAILRLDGASHIRIRNAEKRTLVVDDLGRIVVLGADHQIERWLLVR